MYITAVGFCMVTSGIILHSADKNNEELEGDFKSFPSLVFTGGFIISLCWVSNLYIVKWMHACLHKCTVF